MPHVSDCEYAVLIAPPYSFTPAHIHDMELQWLHYHIAAPVKEPALKDAWRQFLDEKGVKDFGAIQDQQDAWLTIVGAPAGSLQDKFHWFWCTKGGDPAPAFNMSVFAACISAQGWSVISHDSDSIDIDVGVEVVHITVFQIASCNYPAGIPAPLENDLSDCAQAQGYCL